MQTMQWKGFNFLQEICFSNQKFWRVGGEALFLHSVLKRDDGVEN